MLTHHLQVRGGSFPAYPRVRPQEVALWIKASRPWKDMAIDNVSKYQCAWKEWWSCLGRVSATDSEADKENLRKLGKNGFLVVMVSLVWWGVATKVNNEWRHAVRDVTAALRALRLVTSSLPPSNTTTQQVKKRKRTSEGIATDSSNANAADDGLEARPTRVIK